MSGWKWGICAVQVLTLMLLVVASAAAAEEEAVEAAAAEQDAGDAGQNVEPIDQERVRELRKKKRRGDLTPEEQAYLDRAREEQRRKVRAGCSGPGC